LARLIECVPNFSEGRDANVVKRIEDAIRSVRGIMVLGSEMDASHNRSVLTFAGTPASVADAAFAAAGKALELIDMNRHHGEHPRIGATDVIPVIPLSDVSMEECVSLSVAIAKRISDELGIPTYLYEQSAKRPGRKNLSDIRKGEYEGLRESILTDEERKPDFGGPALHPTAGATVVGARPILVAYNIYLNTADVSVAKRIAKKIRERDGGLPGVKALGFFIREKNMAQVSINLTDLSKTGMLDVYDRVAGEAEIEGYAVAGSEVVGMVPASEFIEIGRQKLKLMEFNKSQMIESRLLDLISSVKGE
jgi:glutamate formiminotransferase